ncbi:MAG: GntR family transcriptional regulator [Coriobacteriales bacterium]|nr:GntR family transcriptional regulator [Coriobacteriales bacterium]
MKDFQIDADSGIPVWVQVRKRLVYCIVSGHYGAGEKLPTVRELAVQLGINYNTVNKVYQDLERDGFITTQRGKGTFVAQLEAGVLRVHDNQIELLADELVSQALDFGMTGDEIVAAVQARVAQQQVLASGGMANRGADGAAGAVTDRAAGCASDAVLGDVSDGAADETADARQEVRRVG